MICMMRFIKLSSFRSLFFLPFLIVCNSIAYADFNAPSLNNVLSLPEWLSISGSSRVRIEALDEQFRVGRGGDDQILIFQNLLLLEANAVPWKFALELLDARQALGDDSTRITPGNVNPLDVLQAYLQFSAVDVFGEDSLSSLRAGRFTMDLGSRRFVSRNRYRNTINAFSGVEWQLTHSDDSQLRAFFTLPVGREPTEFDRLERNRSEGDDQNTEVKFWGLHYELPTNLFDRLQTTTELYYYGLDENDTNDRPTRNRDIHTIGTRIYKSPAKNEFDYQIETAIQFGESRLTSASTDREDLNHFAQFYHAEFGYSFDHAWSPRLLALFDFASGDDDPDDNKNQRFDSLFGVGRGDFNPLGIYGPFARANLISPGLRVHFKPLNNVSMFVAHRGFWLASDRDAWVVAGVRDTEGDSGSFIGQQSEVRVRWDVAPKRLQLEAGYAYLFKGGFAEDAPNANGAGDPNLFYSQATFKF